MQKGNTDGALAGAVPARDVVDPVGLEVEVEAGVVHEVPQLDADDLGRDSIQSSKLAFKLSPKVSQKTLQKVQLKNLKLGVYTVR